MNSKTFFVFAWVKITIISSLICLFAQDMHRYDFDLLSIELPENWNIIFPEDEYGLFDAKDINEFRYVIASKEKIGEVSLEELFQKFIYNEDILLYNGSILDSGSTEIDGNPSKWVIHYQEVYNKKIVSINFILIHQNNQIIIGGYAREDIFDQNKEFFNRLVSSIKLK